MGILRTHVNRKAKTNTNDKIRQRNPARRNSRTGFLYVSPYGGGVCCVAEYEEHRKGKDCKWDRRANHITLCLPSVSIICGFVAALTKTTSASKNYGWRWRRSEPPPCFCHKTSPCGQNPGWRFCPISTLVLPPFSLRYFKIFYNWFRTVDSTAVCNSLIISEGLYKDTIKR